MDLAIVTIPPLTDHTHTVVFLHGRGDTAKNFASSIHYSPTSRGLTLPEAFPSFRWVFPSAGIRDVACMPSDRRSQWFDVWDVRDFKDHEEIQQPGLRESVAAVRKILRGEAEMLGGQWGKVVLAGISQGGAVGIHTLLNLATDGEAGLGAFLGFSSRLPFVGQSLSDTRKVLGLEGVPAGDGVLRRTPMLLEHCVDDPLVLVDWGRQLRDQLVGYGAQVTWKEYPDGGHWFNSPRGIDDVVAFISQALDVKSV
ncbi:hypothetical protein ACHAQH_002511 [Verticillium albo-atrum]